MALNELQGKVNEVAADGIGGHGVNLVVTSGGTSGWYTFDANIARECLAVCLTALTLGHTVSAAYDDQTKRLKIMRVAAW